ncbi:peptidase U62 [Virgisporangium aliadipatigenens]|uniref:Peptidase U62 n=1 Tax=Virgisporangium aliadipatigenens TaxID=741659 RepID=A0A8J4DUJ0_9ACTN|nr:metallopeptidase TldD-related protein [Virgisporangium aliadipatigenens]GIJ50098.1 peptidase U62 [Virgisporangium aliadipatigenens]
MSAIVEQVLSLVPAGVEAEVTVVEHASAVTRFANSYIHQNVADTGTRVTLRLHAAGRTASGSTTTVDAAGLARLVERLTATAALLPPDALWAGVAPAGSLDPAARDGFASVDPATAAATPAERAAVVGAFVESAKGLLAAGYVRTSTATATFGNTAGQSLRGGYTEASLDGVARAASTDGGPADGVARATSRRLADLDGGLLGARAAAKAQATIGGVDLPPDDYEVVLEPQAVGDLLSGLSFYVFNGRAFAERRSFARPGEAQFDGALTLVDDALAADTYGVPFDAEGTPKRRTELVRDGVTQGVPHDRRTAREVGAESTGHSNGFGDTFGPMGTHLAITPAGGPAATEATGPVVDSDVAALVAGVRRGLLVTDFWYTRVLDPRSAVITGLTRNGVWLIEDGEVTAPVRNLRFTQSYPAALAPGRVLGIGAHAHALVERYSGAAHRAPALRLASWHFTGGASG